MYEQDRDLLDTTNINKKVYDFLKKRIINLTYLPGTKLNLHQLGRKLGISQTPIKDALSRLAGEGLVEITSRRGTYVKKTTPQEVAEIFDILMMLETGVAEMMAKQTTAEQRLELEQCHRKILMENANADYSVFIDRVSEFHMAIIRLTNNNTLLRIAKQLNVHMQILRFRFAHQVWEKPPTTYQDYEDILAAFKERDPLKVREAIRVHLLSMKKFFLERIAE